MLIIIPGLSPFFGTLFSTETRRTARRLTCSDSRSPSLLPHLQLKFSLISGDPTFLFFQLPKVFE